MIDPASGTLASLGDAGTGRGKWHGIALGPDGKLYCAPYNAPTVRSRRLTLRGRQREVAMFCREQVGVLESDSALQLTVGRFRAKILHYSIRTR